MSPNITADVDIRCPAWRDDINDADQICTRAALAAVMVAGRPAGGAEVSVVLCDDAFITDLNFRYRDRQNATNVLAFPQQDPAQPAEEPVLLGDIVVAHGTVAREAADAGRRVDHHLSHMVVHGMLHLLGFDHLTDVEADAMETLEIMAMARLGLPDPYAGEDGSFDVNGDHDDDR